MSKIAIEKESEVKAISHLKPLLGVGLLLSWDNIPINKNGPQRKSVVYAYGLSQKSTILKIMS